VFLSGIGFFLEIKGYLSFGLFFVGRREGEFAAASRGFVVRKTAKQNDQ
jgi:hypothetical protein